MIAVRAIIILSILSVACAAVYLPAQMKGSDVAVKTAILMGTIVEIKVIVDEDLTRPETEHKIEAALEEVRRVENMFSVYDESSEVSKINTLRKGDKLKISEEAFNLIEKAISLCNATNGAFDITVKPLVDIWAEAKKTGKVPSAEARQAAMEKTGFRDIILDKEAGTIGFAKDGMAIDLGGIAKGYAADRAVTVLKENGIRNAIVNCGGDMYCLGKRSRREQWKVGIRHPRDKENIALELRLEDKAVDTSGDYEKYFMVDGKRYSHIIDPRSGYPIGDKVVSASVIAGDSVTADAFATALCVLGREELNTLDGIIFVSENGKLEIEMSNGVREKYHVTETR